MASDKGPHPPTVTLGSRSQHMGREDGNHKQTIKGTPLDQASISL